MPSSFSRPQPSQACSRQPANDIVPAAISFAALGLDSSQAEVTVCFLLPDGSEVVPRWTVPNSQPGAQALAERVQALAKAQSIKELRIGWEATGLSWWHLAGFLKETPALTEVNHSIYVFNPALVQGREARLCRRGQDGSPGCLLHCRAAAGRAPAHPFSARSRLCAPATPDALPHAPGSRASRARRTIAWPCFSCLLVPLERQAPFDDLFSPTSLGILETFTTEDLAQTSLEDLASFVQHHGRGRFADPHQVATTLRTVGTPLVPTRSRTG